MEDGYNGYLFKMGNVEELVEKIRLMDSDSGVRELGNNSRRRFEERFISEKHYEKLLNVFKSVLKTG